MTATVLELHPHSALRQMPVLTLEAREEGIRRLGAAIAAGDERDTTETAGLVCWYSSDARTAEDSVDLFADYVNELRRIEKLPHYDQYQGVDQSMCEDDRDAALGDLVNGTNRYRGDRSTCR
jgi:hypothetical protein